MKPRITIIGLGRLGASIGLALKKTGAELEIVGHDKQSAVAQNALKMGAVDKTEWNLYNACEGAGLIILAMPLAGVLETIALLKDDIAPGVIVTDTASVKVAVQEAARAFKPGVHFIGGHPVFRPSLDGGVESSAPSADLFQNAVYCLTPAATVEADAIQLMTGLVAMLGAKPLFLDAVEHDGLAAGAQHLASVLSVALLKTTTSSPGWRELHKFAGDSYARATALAAADPITLRELFLAQREPLQRWIEQVQLTLRELRSLLAQDDSSALDAWLAPMQAAREQWLAGQVGAAPTGVDLGELRSGAMRMLVGGLADRIPGTKKK